MSMTYTTRPKTYGTSLTARLAVAITSIPQAISDWHTANKTVRSLNKLSDRQLDDIGLTRGDVQDMGR